LNTPTAITEQLADFGSGLRFEDVPADVRSKVLLHTLDQIGAAILGSTKEWSSIVRSYALDESPEGSCTVIGADRPLRAEWAALSNGTAGHGMEADDWHQTAIAHPACVAVPTVLAVGEEVEAGGHEALVSLALGFETIVRVGLAAEPSSLYDRGFHETGTLGVFGAAIAAARLRSLPATAYASALGIAGSHASGTTEYSVSGGEIKRLHAGLAAMGGIRAVALAERGFTGPRTILEGPRGFLQAFANTTKPQAIVDGLGERWEVLGTAIKPYFCCALIHAPIAALQTLIARGDLKADDIAKIVVGGDRLAVRHVGRIGPRPADMTGAQFSMEFSLGMTVALGGNDFSHYSSAERDGFVTPEILRVADCVTLVLDEEADAAFPEAFLARVRVHTRDGRILEEVAYAPGSFDNPLDEQTIRLKFRSIAEPLIGTERTRKLEAAVDALADGGQVSAITDNLRAYVPEAV
jgi:2-methylcitrate dehydratase PrpD